jgi:hypothetical protein
LDLEINNEASQFSILARQLCIENAVRVAEIISLYNQHFDIRNLFGTTMQHAGTAASVLVAHVSSSKGLTERTKHLKHIITLRDCLSGMGETYAPAQKMTKVLEKILRQSFSEHNNGIFSSPVAAADMDPEYHATQHLALSVDSQTHKSFPSKDELTPEINPINEDWETLYGVNAIRDNCSHMSSMINLEESRWELEDYGMMQSHENWDNMYPLGDGF